MTPIDYTLKNYTITVGDVIKLQKESADLMNMHKMYFIVKKGYDKKTNVDYIEVKDLLNLSKSATDRIMLDNIKVEKCDMLSIRKYILDAVKHDRDLGEIKQVFNSHNLSTK